VTKEGCGARARSQAGGGARGGEKRGETNPFPVRVLVLLVCFVQIHAVETADGEGHDDLDEAEDGMQDVGEGHFDAVEDAHFGWYVGLCFLSLLVAVEFGLAFGKGVRVDVVGWWDAMRCDAMLSCRERGVGGGG